MPNPKAEFTFVDGRNLWFAYHCDVGVFMYDESDTRYMDTNGFFDTQTKKFHFFKWKIRWLEIFGDELWVSARHHVSIIDRKSNSITYLRLANLPSDYCGHIEDIHKEKDTYWFIFGCRRIAKWDRPRNDWMFYTDNPPGSTERIMWMIDSKKSFSKEDSNKRLRGFKASNGLFR